MAAPPDDNLTEGSLDNPARRYGTRPAIDRRQPANLSGFVIDTDAAVSRSSNTAALPSTQSATAPQQSQLPRPKPRPYDPALHLNSDSDEEGISTQQLRRRQDDADEVAAMMSDAFGGAQSVEAPRRFSLASSSSNGSDSSNAARLSLPSIPSSSAFSSTSTSTEPQKAITTGGRAGLGSRAGGFHVSASPPIKKVSKAKGSHLKSHITKSLLSKSSTSTPKITAAFASIPASAMCPPPLPASQARTSPVMIETGGSESDSQIGADLDHPIDIDDDDGRESSSTHKRKDTSPQAALAAAQKSWDRAQNDERERQKAAKDNSPWIPSHGRTASKVYLNYGPPKISKNKDGTVCIAFSCKCCDPPLDVVRPYTESSTSNLLTHVQRVEKKRGQVTIPAMFASQASTSATDNAPLLTPSLTRQMAVAWVSQSARPLSVVEDSGFLAFLSEAQKEMMPSRFTVSRDLDRVFKGMVAVLKAELASVDGCFHLAIDVWTSANGHSFLGLIICYQHSGKAIRRLLEMVPFLEAHGGAQLAAATSRVLEKYGIGDRVWNIISDNASENNKMMRLLADEGKLARFKQNDEMNCRVRCSAHVLNLVSKAVLKPFMLPRRKKKDASNGDDASGESASGENEDGGEEGVDSGDDSGDVDWTVTLDSEDAEMGEDDDDEEETHQVALEEESDWDISIALNPETTRIAPDDQDLDTILKPNTSAKRSARLQKELDSGNREVGLAVTKTAWISTTLHYSPAKRRLFKKCCNEMGCDPKVPRTLLRDVATRWDSTFHMVDRSIQLFDGIIAFSEMPNSPVPQDKRLKRSDRVALVKIRDLLQPLANATLKFSAKVSPTIGEVIGMFEDIDDYFTAMQESKSEEYVWQQAAARGHLVNAKYYSLTDQADIYSLAILLHPNYRSTYMDVLKWPRDWQDKAEDILRTFHSSYYETKPEPASEAVNSQTDEFEKLDKTTKALLRKAKEKQQSVAPRDVVGDWLSGLTPMEVVDGKAKRVNPLSWWWLERQKGNEHEGLTSLALDVFSCPATSVDVERLFSRAGRVVTPLRHCLRADRISHLVTVGKWFEEGSVPSHLLASILDDESDARKAKRKAKAESSANAKRARISSASGSHRRSLIDDSPMDDIGSGNMDDD
ncbi:hypothetical protein A4X13_0g7527 [Tilletia indica]|uniref:HAT C-terminal dimerisation domain-containing protein n=1 Tax=Tilletia indica TaxID=43049 RepID=A0A177TJG5_9BASI|nr:hypothetical protein A4X13_0g7527 [Tilletia indica]